MSERRLLVEQCCFHRRGVSSETRLAACSLIRWSTSTRQYLKCLTVVDEFTYECLAIDVAGSTRSGRVVEVPSKLVSVHGSPKHLRSDNGPEFVSELC